MSQILKESEIRRIVNCLYDTIGVRMRVDSDITLDNPAPHNFPEYCRIIQNQLELPVRVIPEFVTTQHFSGLPGYREDINTQVSITDDLPAYGSDALKDFPIAMKVNLGINDPYYVLTQLSIAFARIYLHSLRDPLKDMPLAVDLCAMMMGFTPYWRRGRANVSKRRKLQFPFIETTKVTTQQGSLREEDYEIAESYIEQLQNLASMVLEDLKRQMAKIRELCGNTDKKIEELQELVAALSDCTSSHKIKQRDAELLSRLSRPDTVTELKRALEQEKKRTNDTVKPMRTLRSYTQADVESMKRMSATLDHVLVQLKAVSDEVDAYTAAAKRYINGGGLWSKIFG